MISFEVVTLFPSLFEENTKQLPFKKALEKAGIDIPFEEVVVSARGKILS